MKLLILCLAILGVATAAAVPAPKVHSRTTRGLQDDFQDFLNLIDTDAIVGIVIQYLAEDQEVQNLVAYVLSEDFKELVLAVEQIPEYIKFLDYLQAAGLDVYKWINVLHDLLGLPGLGASTLRGVSSRMTGGIAGLWADLKEVLPLKELYALFKEKLETSPEFAALIDLLTSDEAQKVYDALKANEEFQWIKAKLIEAGLDVDAVFDVLKKLVGWH